MRSLLCVPLLMVALAACGSTVPLDAPASVGQGAQPGTTTDAFGAPVSSAPVDSAPVSPTVAGDGGAPVAGSTGTGSAPVAAVGTTAGAGPSKATSTKAAAVTKAATASLASVSKAAGAIPTTGKGWDAKYVYIGVTTEKDIQGIAAGLGYSALDPGDNEAQANAVAADINARGGLFGRQVKITFKDVSTTAVETDVNSVENQVCTFFTQDSPVVAVLNVVTVMDYDNFRTCLTKAGVPLISASSKAVDDGVVSQLGGLFVQTVNVSWTALAPVMAQQLKAQGYFSPWNATTGAPDTGPTAKPAKVGIVTDSSPMGTRIAQTVKSALAGVGITNVVVYQYAQASDGQGNTVSSFEGQGVTHVIMDDVELTAFQSSAQTQVYKPRYGISTYNDPYTNLQASSPKGANVGAIGVGWAPDFDVDDADDPGSTGPGEAACLATMAKANQSFANNKRLAQGIAKAMCDGLELVTQGAVAGGGLTGKDILNGAIKLGSTFKSAEGFSTGLSATHAFVPGAVRALAFNSSCSCFKYSGPPIPF